MIFKKFNLNTHSVALGILVALPGVMAHAQNDAPVLEQISVVASRVATPLRQVGASVSVVTAEELEQKSFPILADVLRTLPGVSVTQSGGFGKGTSVRVRGEEAYRTLLLIDGINVSDVSAPQAMPHFAHVTNGQFARVEVLRGPQGMMYGADAGGVISAHSKQSEETFEGDLAAETGRFDTHRLNGNLRGTVDRVRYSFTASGLTSGGFNAYLADPTGDRDGYENLTLHGTAEVAVTENTGVGLVLRSTDGENEYDGGDAADYREDYQQQNAKLDWHYRSEQQDHEIAYLRSTTDRFDWAWESEFESKIAQWQYLGRYKMADDLSFVFGADHRTDAYISTYIANEEERDQTGAFGEAQVSFGDNFFYTLGLRYDDNEDFGEHLSYRLTAAYLIPVSSGEVKLKASQGTGFRAPSLYEIGHNVSIAEQFALPGLTEEKSEGYELGVEWHIRPETFVELVWFDNRIEDEIFWLNLGGWDGGYVQAEGESQSQGVELIGSMEMFDRLVFSGNYTYNRTELSENTAPFGAEPGDPRPRRPKHKLNLSLQYRLWQDSVRLAVFYRNSRDAVDYATGTPVALDDYQVVDLNGSWQVNDRLETYIRWENALDENYQEIAGYNTAGSAGYVGARVRF